MQGPCNILQVQATPQFVCATVSVIQDRSQMPDFVNC